MKELQLRRCWAVAKSDGHGRVDYLSAKPGVIGEPATADNLTTYSEAGAYLSRVGADKWPCPYAIALDLEAGGVISIALMNAWDEAKQTIVQGADQWADMLNSYTERCVRSVDGVSLRILVRGKLPEGATPPRSVRIQTDGWITLTCDRIPSRRTWHVDSYLHDASRPSDPNPGAIVDATEALAALLVPCGPKYILV